MQIEILDDAEEDIKQGIDFYEAQSKGLGSYFLSAILTDIESLNIYAGIHIQINGFYRLLSKRFPFSIYYKIKDNIVYAVLECRSKPSWINLNLTNR